VPDGAIAGSVPTEFRGVTIVQPLLSSRIVPENVMRRLEEHISKGRLYMLSIAFKTEVPVLPPRGGLRTGSEVVR